MFQMKEQDKTSEKDLINTEISKLSDMQFKEMVINMILKLGWRMDEHSEKLNKELETIRKKNQRWRIQ